MFTRLTSPSFSQMEAAATTAAQIAASYAANKVFSYAKDKAYDKYQRYRNKRRMPSYKPNTFQGVNARRNLMAAQRAASAPYLRNRQYKHVNRRTGGLIDIEKKFYDQNGNKVVPPATWTTIPDTDGLALPAQGDGPTQRDGRVFYVHSLHLRARILLNDFASAAARSDTIVRLVLLWDTQTNVTATNPSNVYENNGDPLEQFRNLEYSSRYIVLKDRVVTIKRSVVWNTSTSQYVGQEQEVFVKMNKSFKNPVKVRTTGTTSDVSSIADNNFVLIACTAGGTDTVNVIWQSRCRFTG